MLLVYTSIFFLDRMNYSELNFESSTGRRKLEVTLQHPKPWLTAFVGSDLSISGWFTGLVRQLRNEKIALM